MRIRAESGNAAVLPLLLWLIALMLAVFILGVVATRATHSAPQSDAPWSGNQVPPGAVGGPPGDAPPPTGTSRTESHPER